MLDKVKLYLRIEGSQDDELLAPLILAAQGYLQNAGVTEPVTDGETEPDPKAVALYELAVTLYVRMLYYGAEDKALEAAMTAIILQIKDYGGESA